MASLSRLPKLVEARETLHHAAQLLALVGASFIEPRGDDSHTSMSWLDPLGALVTEPVPAREPFRIGLRLARLTLVDVDDPGEGERASFSLSGRRRSDAVDWLRKRVAAAGLEPARLHSSLHFSIAKHPTDTNGTFELTDDGSFDELARRYAQANQLLGEWRLMIAGAGPVRCWPHHFDIATLVTLPAGGSFETIGVGLSPGDASYAEPYYYVGPSSVPTMMPRPLTIGHWHTDGWWGGALTATEIVIRAAGNDERPIVRRFIHDATAGLLESDIGAWGTEHH